MTDHNKVQVVSILQGIQILIQLKEIIFMSTIKGIPLYVISSINFKTFVILGYYF